MAEEINPHVRACGTRSSALARKSQRGGGQRALSDLFQRGEANAELLCDRLLREMEIL
jgi:hypothetical protein